MNDNLNIVILDGRAANPGDLSWDVFNSFGKVTVYERSLTEDEVIKRSANADILIINKATITEKIMNKCPRLKYIGVNATGYNVVDLVAATKLGITVTNIPSYSTNEVAQMVFALLFEITNQVALHNKSVKDGEWTSNSDFCFWKTPLIAVHGKTLGIIGYGEIGRAVADIAKVFGMKVVVNTRTPSKVNDTSVKMVSIDELYAVSDIISLHCPLTDTNVEMIDAAAISKMKKGVIIINTARGRLINECDLASALKSGKVYAAGCDVVSKEPILTDNPLLECENCIITPHIAWAPIETRQRLLDMAVDNLHCFLAGRPKNVVN